MLSSNDSIKVFDSMSRLLDEPPDFPFLDFPDEDVVEEEEEEDEEVE